MEVALAHHWLTHFRGGEKVLEQLASFFPAADIYTLIHNRRLKIPGLQGHRVIASPLSRVPSIMRWYRHLLPMHPVAIQKLRVPDHVDLLVSSDASMIKGLRYAKRTKHVCYCHSPPRYLWELGDQYKQTSIAARVALDRFAPMLRRFDYDAAQRVTNFIANSHFIADRIRRHYQREAEVVYPPVAVDQFVPHRNRRPFALVISELVAYKRIDLAVEAFNRLKKRLVIIGDGPERKRLESIAKPNIEFLGRQPFSVLKQHYETAAAFVFPGIEDFGITPVEAQAAGCPVIAFRAGGALETVLDGRTGIFFDSQDPEALATVVAEFCPSSLDPNHCRQNAERFSIQEFRRAFLKATAALGVPEVDGVAGPELASTN